MAHLGSVLLFLVVGCLLLDQVPGTDAAPFGFGLISGYHFEEVECDWFGYCDESEESTTQQTSSSPLTSSTSTPTPTPTTTSSSAPGRR